MSDVVPGQTLTASMPWYAGLKPMHWRILTASFMGWIFDGFESFALFLVLPLMLKSLLSPDQLAQGPIWAGIAIGGTLLGWGLGGLVGGVLADYVGRKRMMLWSVFLYAVFTGFTALSTGFWMMLALRFITGIAMGSEWSTGVTLLAETWPERARPKGCGFLQSGFGWGTFLAAAVWLVLSSWSPLGPESWRLMFIVGALPAFFVLYIRRNVGESEKWLAAVREQRWHATEGAEVHGGKRPFTLTEIFREPESRRRVLLTFLLSLVTTVGWWAVANLLDRYVGVMAKNAGYAQPELWGIWASLIYTVGAVIAYLLSGFIMDAIGRRLYIFLAYAGSLVIVPVTYLWLNSPEAVLGAALVNGFFTLGCAYSWMAIYPAELFTSSVRSTAASFIFNATRMIAWVFPILAGTMIQFFGGLAHTAATLGLCYAIGLVVPWFLPETKGKPMPD
ncbi:MAG TPA: MFS transporter [Aliidongia sp.]|nr:MFS transporter [Aliidongia sp.]